MPASSDRFGVCLRPWMPPRRAGRAEGADAVVAIDLLVDAEQHRAEHPGRDHLVEALVREAVIELPLDGAPVIGVGVE